MIRYEISSGDEHWRQIQKLLSSIYMTSKTEIAISRIGQNAKASYPGFLNEHLVCCAFFEDELIGYCRASIENYEISGQIRKLAYIGDHRVNPNHRGQRVAARLAEELVVALGRSGIPLGFYYVNAGNVAQEKMMSRIPNLTYEQGAEFVTSSIPLLYPPPRPRSESYLRIADPENLQPDWTLQNSRSEHEFGKPMSSDVANGGTLGLSPKVSSQEWRDFVARFPEVLFYASIDKPREIKFALFDQGKFKQIKMQNYSPQTKLTTRFWNMAAKFSGASPLPREREPWKMTELCFCHPDFVIDLAAVNFAKREAFELGSQILNLISMNNGQSLLGAGVKLRFANHLHTHLKVWALAPVEPIKLSGPRPLVDLVFV